MEHPLLLGHTTKRSCIKPKREKCERMAADGRRRQESELDVGINSEFLARILQERREEKMMNR